MAECDVFDQDLLHETERRFGFESACTLQLESSRSLTYDCLRDDEHFILKIRPFGGRRTADYTMGEMEFLAHLSRRDIRVSLPVPSLVGKLIEVCDTERGLYMAYAFRKIEGQIIDWKDWTPALYQKWGAMMGRMHSASKDFQLSSPAYMRKIWHEDEEYDQEWLASNLSPEMAEAGRNLLERLHKLPKDRDSFGLVHQDLHQWNFFVQDGELIPFDFEDCLYDWFVGDFSAGLHNAINGQAHYYQTGQYEYWTGGKKMDTPTFVDYFLQNFMEGYRKENSLDSFWLMQLPYFLRRRHLSTYVDRVQNATEMALSEKEQAASFPWSTVREHGEQVLTEEWAESALSKFLARI